MHLTTLYNLLMSHLHHKPFFSVSCWRSSLPSTPHMLGVLQGLAQKPSITSLFFFLWSYCINFHAFKCHTFIIFIKILSLHQLPRYLRAPFVPFWFLKWLLLGCFQSPFTPTGTLGDTENVLSPSHSHQSNTNTHSLYPWKMCLIHPLPSTSSAAVIQAQVTVFCLDYNNII